MGSESVGSSTTPPFLADPQDFKNFRNAPAVAAGGTDRNSALAERMRNDTCFVCKEKGHWARSCPKKTGQKPSLGRAMDGQDIAPKQCPCGGGTCFILTSKTERNPNRKFYRCPLAKGNGKCTYFQWCDIATTHQGPNLEKPAYPMCPCGAGRCEIYSSNEGKNAGQKYFGCPVRKGQGACNFFQWYEPVKMVSELDNASPEEIVLLSSSDSVTDSDKHIEASSSNQLEGDGSEVGESISNGHDEGSYSIPSSNQVKEEADNNVLPSIEKLNLQVCSSDDIPRPGKCFGSGEDGHWKQNCVRRRICYKCGKVGHWKNNCSS